VKVADPPGGMLPNEAGSPGLDAGSIFSLSV